MEKKNVKAENPYALKLFFFSRFFSAAIANRKSDSLKPVQTVEKNNLPSKEDIEAEKKSCQEEKGKE